MKLLPIWRFTHTLPSHKDSESATVIEQTYKLYQTMQELITECNEFSENVNNKLIEFVTKYEEDIDTFTTSFRQEYQDFIDVVELKLENQDKRIQEIGQTVLEYIQPTIDELLTAIENNLRDELLTLINDNVTPQIQTIDNKLMWINDSIDGLTITQVEHTTKLAELDYKKADKEVVSDLEQVIIPRIETSLNETNTRVSDLEQVTIPRIEEDIESLKGGTGNVEPLPIRLLNNEELEQSLNEGNIAIDLSYGSDGISGIYIDWDNVSENIIENTNQINVILNPNQKVIIKATSNLLPEYLYFETSVDVGLNVNTQDGTEFRPYWKYDFHYRESFDTIGSKSCLLWFDDFNGCIEFSIKYDNISGGYYYSLENSRLEDL